MVYAIDFGTSNTVIGRWNPVTQQPETISLLGLSLQMSNNPPLIPSLLYVEDATHQEVIVGQAVRDHGLDLGTNPRFFRNFKRGIGTDIQGFMPELDGQTVTFEQAGQWFLQTLIQQLQSTDPNVDALVFTVPVDSFEAYRLWLTQLCKSLQVNEVRLLDEPTAAALGYGLDNQGTILVVDFGGGTLDLSLVRLEGDRQSQANQAQAKPLGFLLKWGQKVLEESAQRPKLAKVIAKAGQNLGGADIDNWLADYFQQTQAVAITPLTLRLVERLKIQLSQQSEATEVYFNDETFESYELHLDRERLTAILQDHQFFDRLNASMSQVLQQAQRQGLTPEAIDAVLLVGGTTQLPAVQTWIEQYFPLEKIRSQTPFEAIAHGALQLGQGMEVKDFLYHSYGIRFWDRRNHCHGWHPIIRQGQPYPMLQPVELLLGASMEKQPSIELVIGELGEATTSTEVYFDGDRLVTRTLSAGKSTVKPLNDSPDARTIAQLSPPGYPGSDRIRVLFRIDEDRFLRITVEDLLTAQTLVDDRAVVQLS
ncbi:Hsp70 family protein [Thermocoleostomius sinensis]|uniref:Hsp70 family protein n=1 Tax=Thermocoleostomius sinensis A174 TaxID=2016057 RepID=A0A9E8ZDF5_9CYAN|nr:Hsp70 family protein [Thermocoleostomius sinensis]WAL60786.1 Hsp70 family protein [Thermocoleostomius sinensis A174]